MDVLAWLLGVGVYLWAARWTFKFVREFGTGRPHGCWWAVWLLVMPWVCAVLWPLFGLAAVIYNIVLTNRKG